MQDKTRLPSGIDPRDRTDWAALAALTDDEVEAAALADPDAQPWPEGKPMRRGARVRYVRLKLGIPLAAFSERYGIPRETILAWERHKADEDAVALAYLNAILADPEGVAAAVAKSRAASTAGPKAAE